MIEPVKSERGALDAFDQVVDRYLERFRCEPCSAGSVRRGHVADVVSGSGGSVGAFLTEASGDLLAEVVVLGFEAADFIQGVFESPFQRFGGGTLGGGWMVAVAVREARSRSISARRSGWR